MVDAPAVEQNKNNVQIFEKQFLNIEVDVQSSAEMVDAPVVEQIFGSWDELDHFVSFYTKSQNFVKFVEAVDILVNIKVIVLQRIRQILLRINDKHKVNILDAIGRFVQQDETNKFASKYRAFSEDMLKDIKFWTEIVNLNMRKRQDD
ncbi:10219_t:CDS:2, partial [Racocetra fulgida]